MNTALALHTPSPAIARARAARGYVSLAMEAHFAAMARRARMNRVADAVELPKPARTVRVKAWFPDPPIEPLPPLPLTPSELALIPTLSHGSIYEIQTIVARYYGVTRRDILSSRRHAVIVKPRQVAMYLAKELTNLSLPSIGRLFNNKDHTTILSGCRKIARLIEEGNKILADDVSLLRAALTNGRSSHGV